MQDKHSHSFLVRLYYQQRIFMGFCCVSCEVLYLMVRPSPPALLVMLNYSQSLSVLFGILLAHFV